MTPADMKEPRGVSGTLKDALAAEFVCVAANGPDGCYCFKGPQMPERWCAGMNAVVACILATYGLDRSKANGLAEGRLRIKRATRKEGE